MVIKGSVLNYEMLRYCTKYVISFQTIIQLDMTYNTTKCMVIKVDHFPIGKMGKMIKWAVS